MSLPEVDLLPDPSGIVHRMLGNDGGWLFSLAASFSSGKEKVMCEYRIVKREKPRLADRNRNNLGSLRLRRGGGGIERGKWRINEYGGGGLRQCITLPSRSLYKLNI